MSRNDGSAPRRYDELTSPEIDEAAEDGATIVVPVGATEDHGPHLPLDVDRRIVEAVCEPAVAARDDALLFPTIDHGYLPHHMDFPGGITIDWRTFVDYVIDVCVSLAHHGFERILLVNGHGSNHHLLELASRQVMLQYPDIHCAMLSWWEIDEVRDRERGSRGRPAGVGPRGRDGDIDFTCISTPSASTWTPLPRRRLPEPALQQPRSRGPDSPRRLDARDDARVVVDDLRDRRLGRRDRRDPRDR